MFDPRSITKDYGSSAHTKTASRPLGSDKRFGYGCSQWGVVVALLLLASPSFAQDHSKRIADEREIIDAIDESGVPLPGSKLRETLEAVAEVRLQKRLALGRELRQSYLEKGIDPAPIRESMKVEVVASDVVLDRLAAFIQRETSKRPVDWSLVKPASSCMGAAPGDDRVVTACQAVLSVPLETPENEIQIGCVKAAISKLAKQCTPAALDTLRQCTKLGSAAQLDILPESPILKDANGCPTLFAIRLAWRAAFFMEMHAPPDVMVAFFSDVERDTTEVECHPLIGAIAEYVRNAELLRSGKDPF